MSTVRERRETGADADAPAPRELTTREVRALSERMVVLPPRLSPAPEAGAGTGLFHVTGESGASYVVDVETGGCTCPDAKYREREQGCKHALRVQFETGARPLPAWLDAGEVGDDFRQFVAPGGDE